ncbi:MAG: hypothetical protein WC460_00640 [Patescibacteria group bacterium]
MTRIDENNNHSNISDLEAEVEKLKKTLKRKKNKKFFNCGSCLLFFILFLLISGLVGAYYVSLSGLIEVPYFTKKFYHEPRPSYLVNAVNLGVAQKDFIQVLEAEAKKQVLLQKKTTNLKLNLGISEGQLSAMLREQAQKNEALNQRIEYIQSAVLPDELEVFAKLKEPKLFITFNIKPTIEDKALKLKTDNFKIGNLPMPKFIGNMIITNFAAKSINQLLASFSSIFEITAIKLEAKMVSLEILVKNLNFN